MAQLSTTSLLYLLLLIVSTSTIVTLARPIASSPYTTLSKCVGLPDPQTLTTTPLVILKDSPSAATEEAISALLAGMKRNYALRPCRKISLQPEEAPLIIEDVSTTPRQSLPLELFDCDVLEGNLSFGVSHDFSQSKQSVYAAVFQDPVEASLRAFHEAAKQRSHPMHPKTKGKTIHDIIREANALSDEDKHLSPLTFNAMTWRLCGYECTPQTMSINEALERATHNLNSAVIAVLVEGSQLWMETVQATVKDAAQITQAKRAPKLSAGLSSAEQGILEHANFADRILYSIALGHEAEQRRCVQAATQHAPARHLRLI